MDGKDFIQHVIHENERRRLFGIGTVKAPVSDHELSLLMVRGDIKVKLKRRATIGNPERILWVAPEKQGNDSLSDIFSDPLAADRIRDLLGLNHYKKGAGLVAIHLPINKVKKFKTARPTVVDSGGYERFKSEPDLRAHRKRRAFGYTVDLERLAGKEKTLDGWSERVLGPIPAVWFKTVTASPLGLVTSTHAKTGMDDRFLCDHVCSKHGTTKDILKRLKNIK